MSALLFVTHAEFHTKGRKGRRQESTICKPATARRASRFLIKGWDVSALHSPVRVSVSFKSSKRLHFLVEYSRREYLLQGPRGIPFSRGGTGNDSL